MQIAAKAHNDDFSVAQAWLRVAVLFGLGVYFVYNIISGNLANYINARFVWLSYLAAAFFFVLMIGSTIATLRRDTARHDGTEPISWGVIATLAIPLLLGTLVPSEPLGAEAVGGISTTAVLGTNEANFVVSPANRNILDWLRLFGSTDDMTEFNGQQADVSGFVYREPSFPENHFMVARFTVSCCVADAYAIGLPVYYVGDNLTDGEWVQVQGVMQVGDFREDVVPIVQADKLTQIEQPEHPYLYP